MAKFEDSIGILQDHEGGLVDDPVDPGGITNWGVSLRFLREAGEDLGDVDGDGDIDAADIRALSKDQAKEIFRVRFWVSGGYDRIGDSRLATKIFDMAVNMGPRQAHKLVQRALNQVSHVRVEVDGVLGAKSHNAMTTVEPFTLIRAIADESTRFYIEVTKARVKRYGLEKGFRYLHGWIRRAYKLV